ncbi:tRNA dimethylallyltransferase, mitochondrial [Mycoemilia scoparia]|uniref:tRNA dimethylallyltransferase n=1 Tax=Mycoemilia scoparia TaxID=417184 RepID=A0A9W7ZYB4_9FUNG|nr:tRNA dimethylallyltransferase, mitochondrial [Mycoemilia scoparia]
MSKNCVFAIIGTTGVGKSKLAVELAKVIKGEVYRGYDTITNKIPLNEQDGIPHHLLGYVDESKEYTVQDYERDATKKIDEIHGRGKWPILVGGTHYYLQSTIFKKSLILTDEKNIPTVGTATVDSKPSDYEKIHESKTNEELYKKLQDVDPLMANHWHINDRRKILRSLQVYETTGKRQSEWIKDSEDNRAKSNTLRYPLCIFWLYSDPNILEQRLKNRMYGMVDNGLLDEIAQFRKRHKSQDPQEIDYTRGIAQSIGFCEFEKFFKMLESTDNKTSDRLEEIKEQALEEMNISNRQYARRQVKWIKNKLIPQCKLTKDKDVQAYSYLLDATDLGLWDKQCRDVATEIAQKFLNKKPMPDPGSLGKAAQEILKTIKEPKSALTWKKYYCKTCSKSAAETRDGVAREVWLNGDDEYQQHIRSRQHKKNIKYREMLETNPHLRKKLKIAQSDNEKTAPNSSDGKDAS